MSMLTLGRMIMTLSYCTVRNLSLIVFFCSSSILYGQSDDAAKNSPNGLATGPLQECNEALRRILRFRMIDGRLAFDRKSWNEWLKATTKPLPSPKDFTRDDLEREERRLRFPPEVVLFQEELVESLRDQRRQERDLLRQLRDQGQITREEHEARQQASRFRDDQSGMGSAVGKDVARHHCYIRIPRMFNARIDVQHEKLHLFVHENDGPYRKLDVRAGVDGSLEISLLADEIIRITQSTKGRLQIFDSTGDPVLELDEASFEDVAKEHHNYLTSRLIPTLQHWGVDLEHAVRKAQPRP